jgi:uncharacterized protein (DUF2126 family)
MTIRVSLNHQTIYRYDRGIHLGPQVIRLRPAAHCRTPIDSYSLRISPADHYLNWQQDPFGNYLARCVFNEKVNEFSVEVDIVATMTVINPFDFFLEPDATQYPFSYEATSIEELRPYLHQGVSGAKLNEFLGQLDYTPRRTIDFLVDMNIAIKNHIEYTLRMEPGVQTPEETLTLRSGSCRDSGWLMVELLRQLGFAARFVSGYLIQLTADQKSLDGPSGPEKDFTDLHAWAEVFLPGAGWIGMDPTSGLFAGEGHIPLACTPKPTSAAPITGTLEHCDVEFKHHMSVARIHEDPRVTLPYSDHQWQRIETLGRVIDEHLQRGDVRLTMGGEPTFVSIDDMDGEEWQTAAVGPTKRGLAYELLLKLKSRFGHGALLHFGQGKWYPGESLPRWAMAIFWRKDGEPIWRNEALMANVSINYGHTVEDAQRFARQLALHLGTNPQHVICGYEDAMYYMWRERRLPINVDLKDSKLEQKEERERIARVFEQGLTSPVGVVMPIRHVWWNAEPQWISGPWRVRSEEMFLLPGDSPMGYRLPLQSLQYEAKPEHAFDFFVRDPFEKADRLATNDRIRQSRMQATVANETRYDRSQVSMVEELEPAQQPTETEHGSLISTALCIEVREGRLHVFLPPTDRLESFLELIAAIELTAEDLQLPVVMEGYQPPHDTRLQHMKVTPDPGVIEVNVHPAHDWSELVSITHGVYEEARLTRLGTEKFDQDGQHTGTGGGNHVVLGGLTPADSPFLRRPDLLKSLIMYWHNHPSLSYLFSGKFIGPTSQAPRVDESRTDAIYELKIACQQIRRDVHTPPWLVDRVFRHLLVDVTGNTHRAEFCIDKLYSPDSSAGRLGLVEFRGFEMPPHARMSLTQQLLIRALVARFWEQPYEDEMVDWGTSLHDRFMLPHFCWEDFGDVIQDLQGCGYEFELEWFGPHREFRFPVMGEFSTKSIRIELRKAIEPWYVLGEESTASGTSRYVDSSVERLQVLVHGMTDSRHVLTCNGRRVPLHPTGVEGEFIAGIRYRAWQPPSCLHPTIPIDSPLVFDLVDSWNQRSIGGCQYHVSNPTGLNSTDFPINAFEAESRRASRFLRMGHTPGKVALANPETNREFPMTLDLRKDRWPIA